MIVIDQSAGSNNEGTDKLRGIERIIFNDMAFALDIDGSAGMVAKLIGAVFGAESVSNADYVAVGLSKLEKSPAYEELADFAIAATGVNTPAQVASLLWSNLMGTPPTAEQAQPYIDLLNSGTSIGELGVFAAEHPLNQANIALAELRESGIIFDPLGFVV